MGFYDSVKDDIREENGAAGTENEQDADDGDDDMPFDHLKEGAETDDDDEQQDTGSDTDIEVLTDDGIKPVNGEDTQDTGQAEAGSDTPDQEAAAPGQTGTQQERSTAGAAQDPATGAEETAGGTSAGAPRATDGADDEVLATLQRIEQQNDDMLDVLRGIKRSLDS